MRILLASLLLLTFHSVQSQVSGDESEDVQDLLVKVESLIERIESHEELINELLDILDSVNRNVIEIKAAIQEEQAEEEENTHETSEEIITDPLKIGNAELRLAGGSTTRSGRLEVYHDGRWGTVCDDDFTDADAAIICQSLGLPHGDGREIHNFGGGDGKPILLDQVNCREATDARHCTHAGWGIHNCQHGEDLGISCL